MEESEPMTRPSQPDALARLEAYREARESGDRAAILAASRAALAAAEANDLERGQAAVRTAYRDLPDDAAPDAIERAEADAYHALRQDPAARRAILEGPGELPQPPRPLTDWRDAKEPEAVLWRHDDGLNAERWPFVSIGEPAILSGAGGTGKSYVALALALSAAQAGNGNSGDALGFGVRGGPVLLAAYEDSPARLAGRMGRIAGGRKNIPDGLHVLPDPGPLFAGGGERRPGEVSPAPAWDALWQAVATVRPSLIVLDPAAELIDGADANQPGPVRAFMRALAAASEQHNAGVLIVGHDTKGNRSAMRYGEKPGAGAVAGSAAWQDRARAVAIMAADPANPAARLVECIKANHGRDDWGMRLEARTNRYEGFAGWRKTAAFEPGEVPWKPEKPEGDDKATTKGKRNRQTPPKNGEDWNDMELPP